MTLTLPFFFFVRFFHPPIFLFLSFQALDEAERLGKTESSELFTDVYDKKPKHLLQQEEEFMAHLKKYPDVPAAH